MGGRSAGWIFSIDGIGWGPRIACLILHSSSNGSNGGGAYCLFLLPGLELGLLRLESAVLGGREFKLVVDFINPLLALLLSAASGLVPDGELGRELLAASSAASCILSTFSCCRMFC